jgi:hypothetical protein
MNRATLNRSTTRPVPSGNGPQSTSQLRLEPPRRRVQVPQLRIAVFLVAIGALVAVVLFSRAAAREPVIALAQSVERGQVVAADDLMVVYVASDDPIATVGSDQNSMVVGLTAVADLEAGTILTPAQFVSGNVLASGEAVVGVALAPGEYPTLRLAPGDPVDVVVTDPAAEAGRVIVLAVVFDIAELGTQGDRFVSLQIPADKAAEVAAAASADRVRLVLVAGSAR